MDKRKQLQLRFGQRLRELRLAHQMTQEDLAERLHVSPVTISNIERGTSSPAFARLQQIARAFGVDVEELFLFEKEEIRNTPEK